VRKIAWGKKLSTNHYKLGHAKNGSKLRLSPPKQEEKTKIAEKEKNTGVLRRAGRGEMGHTAVTNRGRM